MPSGAKKRKAAKKKQKQETTNNSNASTNSNDSSSPLGNDDPRSQDERESDGGEVGSPASQDHQNHQHPFKETSEESERRDPSPVRSFDAENKSMEEVAQHIKEGSKEVGVEDDDATKIERGLRSEEDSGSQSLSIKHIEFVKETHDESSSSSSSSDDESQVTETKLQEAANDSISGVTPHNGESKQVDSFPIEITQAAEKASFGEADNSVVDAAVVGDLVKPLVTVTEEVKHVPESDTVENYLVPDVVEARLEENEELKKTDEKIFPIVEDIFDSISGVTPHNGESQQVDSFPIEITQAAEKASFDEADNSVVDISVVGDLVKPLITVTEEVKHVPESDTVENYLVPDVIETSLEENEESKKTDTIVEDSVGPPSTVVESVANGTKGKVSPTSNASIVETNDGAGNVRDSKITDSSENQPSLVSAPQVAQRTSWMSCCGLFDLLTGSSR